MSRRRWVIVLGVLFGTLLAGACKPAPSPPGTVVRPAEPRDLARAESLSAAPPVASAAVTPPVQVLLDARVGCENPARVKDACRFDPKGVILPTLVPGARLWLAAGASPQADLVVVGRSGKGDYRVLARWGRLGPLGTRGDGESPVARPIPLGTEPPTMVLVIAHSVSLSALAQVDSVECGESVPEGGAAACEALRRIEALLPPRPRCCVPPDLGIVAAAGRPLEAVRVSGAGDGLAVVEVQFRAVVP